MKQTAAREGFKRAGKEWGGSCARKSRSRRRGLNSRKKCRIEEYRQEREVELAENRHD